MFAWSVDRRSGRTGKGMGVLLVAQEVRNALAYGDRGYVMRRGSIELSGHADDLAGRIDEIEATYLAGVHAGHSLIPRTGLAQVPNERSRRPDDRRHERDS